MENCTIYSHQLNFDKVVEIVKARLPKAKIDFNDGGKQKSLVATIKGGFFGNKKTLKINYRERQNPSYKLDQIECGLTQNLAGMVNFIQSIPAENPTVRDKFVHKVMTANCEMPFMAEPEINSDFEGVLRAVLEAVDGFAFAPPGRLFTKSDTQHFVDKQLDLIIDQNGQSEVTDVDVTVDAKYHDQPVETFTDGQIARRARSLSFLENQGVSINRNLACSRDDADVTLRSKSEVIDRAYALLITAVKGEGIEQEHLVRTVAQKNIDSLSPKEATIYDAPVLNDQEKAYATWRYESLYTMMWALGLMDDLKYPSDICDVQAVVGHIFEPSREEFVDKVSLRSKSEVLDELDKTYRMNWACVNARVKGEEVSGNLNSSVVYERHYSLNWLTSHEGLEWDDVVTNT